MKGAALTILLGTTLLLAPWLRYSRSADEVIRRNAEHITNLFRFGGVPSKDEDVSVKVSREESVENDGTLTCNDFNSCPEGSRLVASPFLVLCGEQCEQETCCMEGQQEENLLTCDDFASCPQGWSLVASPSLIECGTVCAQETCCVEDKAVEVLQDKESQRRLDDNTTGTMTTTTTVYFQMKTTTTMTVYTQMKTTTTMTVYTPVTSNNDTATNATTTTRTTTTTTTTVASTSTATDTDIAKLNLTTATTTTSRVDVETVLRGYITVQIDDPEAFVKDPMVRIAFQEAIAERVGVPKSWVAVLLQLGLPNQRRLSERRAHLRRLAGEATITYVITLPAARPTTGLGSSVTTSSVADLISSTPLDTLKTSVDVKLAEQGATVYVITVQTINAPSISLQTWTTTSTMTIPDAEDDSSAFTRVVLSPAHALALLAVAVSALNR